MSDSIEFVDVLFRFAAIGQLALIFVILIRMRPISVTAGLLVALCPSVAAYLLLTAPLGSSLQDFRGVLMTLTHAVPYLLWLLGLSVFEGLRLARRWRRPALVILFVFVLWHVYFFWYREGQGLFHDLSHALYILLFGHLVYLAARGLGDDLVEPRRKARVLLIAAVSLQFLFITAIELDILVFGDQRLIDTLNSGLLLLITFFVAAHLFSSARAELLTEPPGISDTEKIPEPIVPATEQQLYEALMRFMSSGAYRQGNLTIGRLAKALSTPEHRLRHLINRHLGYRNFSTFLNSYRIREACERLGDASQARIPVLTIALGLGYGSIGPFNRAFKTLVGQTPTEYRRTPRSSS